MIIADTMINTIQNQSGSSEVLLNLVPLFILGALFLPLLYKPLLWLKDVLVPVRVHTMFDDDKIFANPHLIGNDKKQNFIRKTSNDDLVVLSWLFNLIDKGH